MKINVSYLKNLTAPGHMKVIMISIQSIISTNMNLLLLMSARIIVLRKTRYFADLLLSQVSIAFSQM